MIYPQQVDDKHIKTTHLHTSGSGNGSTGKNAHRAKTLTSSHSRDRQDPNTSTRARTLASQFSQPLGRGEYYTIFFFCILPS